MGFPSLEAPRSRPSISWGPCVTRIPTTDKVLYLTFDDGPSDAGTADVLDRLDTLGCPATFFLVATRAQAERALVARMTNAGHAIGNHSLDHTWGPFFGSPSTMHRWISDAESRLADLTGSETVGFRSPAGVRTPPLHWALSALDLPLVHWDLRFFDRARSWTPQRARRALERARPGSIVLLHDVQAPRRLPTFLTTLDAFVTESRERGFRFEALARSTVRRALTPTGGDRAQA